jgi:GTP-binding protein
LELRLIADVGIVGAPNAGKSTLLAALTRAQPKIADYPFTTLASNLGVAELDGGETMVLADIPGLIEGAHSGAGLGSRFLRHVQRTRVLIHLIDGSAPDPLADFSQVNSELALFDANLSRKKQVVAVNKIDLPEVSRRWKEIESTFREHGFRPLAISAKERTGLDGLLSNTFKLWLADKVPEEREELVPVYRPKEEPEAFKVSREGDGGWRVAGKAVERAASMTYWEYDEAVRRFQRVLERLGVDEALRDAGARTGDTVRIGEYELEWQD